MEQPTDQPTEGWTNILSYRHTIAASKKRTKFFSRPKVIEDIKNKGQQRENTKDKRLNQIEKIKVRKGKEVRERKMWGIEREKEKKTEREKE